MVVNISTSVELTSGYDQVTTSGANAEAVEDGIHEAGRPLLATVSPNPLCQSNAQWVCMQSVVSLSSFWVL
jgi:hypothetical protein